MRIRVLYEKVLLLCEFHERTKERENEKSWRMTNSIGVHPVSNFLNSESDSLTLIEAIDNLIKILKLKNKR